MVRKFFVVLLLGLLVISSQIVAAEDYYDWSKVPKINNPQEFARYIESQRNAGETKIPVILTNGFNVNTGDFLILCPASVVFKKIVYDDGQTTRHVIYTLMDYPSTKVINAYRSGNTIWLNAEEKVLYDKAVEIVNEAKKRNGTYNQEYYIYEEIQNRVEYPQVEYNSSQPHFATAYGALVEGAANCQGYSDAFYLLGNMMGWNVGKMGNDKHQWNTIELNGKIYCVDVTWGDDALTYNNRKRKLRSYFYFNAPAEIMAATHQWDRAFEPTNLQPSVDNLYSYYETSSHLRHLSSAEAGLKLLAQKIGNEKFKWFSVMVPYDERYDSFAKASPYFTQELNKTSYRGVYWLRPDKIGKYLFITVDVFNP